MTGEPDVPRLRRALPERMAAAVLPAAAAAWTVAEILHWAHVHGALQAEVAAVTAAALAYGASGRSARVAPWLAWAIGGTGTWLSAALAWGPASAWLSATWAAASLYAAWKARNHPAVTAAREWRRARADWLETRGQWGLHGSHLLGHQPTRLGEEYVIDVAGTGKLASAIARPALAELIATRRGLPKSRVRVAEAAIAGQLRISVRDRDPWAHPIPHPLLDPAPQRDLSDADATVIDAIRDGSQRTITAPVPVGQDPATGRVLTVPLWDERGGKNVSIVGIKGAGKGVLLNNLSEAVTAAPDALMIRVNISVKGAAEARAWGPACHLTALGPEQRDRALAVLRCVSGIIDWRSRQPRDTDVFVPTAADPLIVVIHDEVDAAMKFPAIRAEAENIASKGREFGVTQARAGQRGTAQWTGGSDVRSQDDVFCLGAVNRSTEAMHAAGDLGSRMPDMATYGEGHAGVWAVAELGDQDGQRGRTWKLSDPAGIARIARDRARRQPDLPAACKEFLGPAYEQLLGTDVYAQWAHGHAASPPPRPPAQAPPPPHGDAAAPPAATVATATVEISQLDWSMDKTTEDKFRALDEKLRGTREVIARTEAAREAHPGPDVSPEKMRESAMDRWRQVGEQAEISPEHRERVLDLLKDGTTISRLAEGLGVSRWTARTYLEKLRGEGAVRIEGEKRAARWVLAEAAEDSDGDGS